MAQQPDIQSILAALAAHQPSTTPAQNPPVGQQQGGGYPGYPPQQSIPTPNSLPAYGLPQGLPQPNSSGNFDLSSIKPVNTGSVSFADAIAKARSIAAEKGVVYDAHRGNGGDPRSGGRPSYRSRSRSRSPRRDNNRDGFNPYRDERREGPRTGSSQYGRGRSRSPPRASRGIQSPQRGFQRERSPHGGGGSDENSEVIMIDSSLVGLVIGRQGENLRRVEQESGTRIQFVTPADHPGPQRQCRITGKPRQREDAKQEIYRIMDENQEKLGRDSSRGSGNNRQQSASKTSAQPALREGENSSQIMVPDRTVGLIIGRGGETIRDLQERSGCHINIVGQNKTVNGLRPVNLIGTVAASNMAKDLIMEIVESDTREGQSGGQGSGQYPPRGADHQGGGGAGAGKITESIMVPSDAVGMIIGKGGETIREMQNNTTCKVNVSQASGADIEREISLVGTRQAIEAAKAAIWEKVDAVREKNDGGFSGGRRSGGGGGGGGGRDDGDRYSQPQYGQQQPAYAAQQQYAQPYAQPQQPGAAAPAAAGSDPNAAVDPYAQYGGYQNYMAMWYAAVAAQGQQGQGAAQGGQQPPPMS